MRFMGVLRMWCVLQRWNARLRLLDSRGFVEAQPRRTREDAGRVALAEVDEEVGLDGRALEEGLVDLRVVEARHRPGVEAERARGQDQVGALQAAVAERRLAAAIAGAVEPALRSEEHTSELQSLMRNSYAVFCLNKKTNINTE